MDTNNQEFYEDEEVQEIPVRKKKKKKGLNHLSGHPYSGYRRRRRILLLRASETN